MQNFCYLVPMFSIAGGRSEWAFGFSIMTRYMNNIKNSFAIHVKNQTAQIPNAYMLSFLEGEENMSPGLCAGKTHTLPLSYVLGPTV